ncbi:MAG: VCBS repeat-containing protein [Bryobacteraceae bacterium]
MKPIALLMACLWVGISLPGTLTAADPTFFARRDYTGGGWAVGIADTNGDGIPDLLVTPYQGFGVLLGNGDGSFRSGPSQYLGVQFVTSVAPADLNGDGKVDVVLAAGPMIVLFGNGDGTFGGNTSYSVSDSLGAAVVGDFNGDGILDVAAVGGSGVWLFIGKGGGVFDAGVLTPFNADGWELDTADFNHDGKLDLAVTTTTGIAVLLGNGDGTFAVEPYNAAGASYHLAVGDLNGDGNTDIAAQISGSKYVYLYFGNGAGGFYGPEFANLDSSGALRIGDVNGDGIPDLISDGVEIALGNGNGTFRAPVYYPVASTLVTYAMTVGQLTSNGQLAVVVQNTNVLSVLLNIGKGQFEDGVSVPVTGGVGCEVPADYNMDGKPDVAVCTSSGITILLGTGKESSPFTTGTSIPAAGGVYLVTGDFNNDHIPDLLFSNGSNVYCYLGNGDGTFTLKGTVTNSGGTLAIGDFNHDGNLDFVTTGHQIVYGNGDGTFQTPLSLLPSIGYSDIGAADLNNDGYTDLVLTDVFSSDAYVEINNHAGGFDQAPLVKLSYDSNPGIWFADLNNDGNMDMVIASAVGGADVYLGNGKGEFKLTSEPLYTVGGNTILVADVNGDGIPDIGVNYYGCMALMLGVGDGTFQSPFYLGTQPYAGVYAAANLHGQKPAAGLPDIVTGDGNGVIVMTNTTKP